MAMAAAAKDGDGEPPAFAVVLFYKYVALGDSDAAVEAVAEAQEQLCASLGLTGRIRVAREGINGTLGGLRADVAAYVARMQADERFGEVDWKTSDAAEQPFPALLVRRVKEIVALELPDAECDLSLGGTHLSPAQFRAEQLNTSRDRVALIDVRNTYEYSIGHFAGALNPKTRRFGQFPDWVRAELPVLQSKDKILMYCTGGIRCEKASAFLGHLGLTNVYQLSGGIHRYLEAFPDGGGVFHGKNFVFDERVAMASEDPTITGSCEACGIPHDVVSGARCAYCRIHVLLCDPCRETTAVDDVFCEEHGALVAGSLDDVKETAAELSARLDALVGRGNKGKRRSLRKQLDTVKRRIQRLTPSNP